MDEVLTARLVRHLDGLAEPVSSEEVRARPVQGEPTSSRAPRLLIAAVLAVAMGLLVGGMVVLAGEGDELETLIAGPTPTPTVDTTPTLRFLDDGRAEISMVVLHDTPKVPGMSDLWIWLADLEQGEAPTASENAGWMAVYRRLEFVAKGSSVEVSEGVWQSRVALEGPRQTIERILEWSATEWVTVTAAAAPLISCTPPDYAGCTPPSFTPDQVSRGVSATGSGSTTR